MEDNLRKDLEELQEAVEVALVRLEEHDGSISGAEDLSIALSLVKESAEAALRGV